MNIKKIKDSSAVKRTKGSRRVKDEIIEGKLDFGALASLDLEEFEDENGNGIILTESDMIELKPNWILSKDAWRESVEKSVKSGKSTLHEVFKNYNGKMEWGFKVD